MKYLVSAILALIFTGFANAGEVVKDAEIVLVGNTANGQDDFFIRVQGGAGPCVDSLIKFPRSAAATRELHDRAYSLALAAFAMGNKKVRVFNFVDDSCATASYIEMSR